MGVLLCMVGLIVSLDNVVGGKEHIQDIHVFLILPCI